MRTAVPNEKSIIEDGDGLALPPQPPMGTINYVVSAGAPNTISASGGDQIIWAQISDSPAASITLAAGNAVAIEYVAAQGIWYVFGMGELPVTVVNSYNTRTGVVTSQLSDVGCLMSAKGDLIVGSGLATGALLSTGLTNNWTLVQDSTQTTGLKWISPTALVESGFVGANTVFVGTGFGTGTLLGVAAAVELGFTGVGQLYVGTGTATGELFPPGNNQQFLRSNSAQTAGLDWVYGATVVESGFTAAGQLFVGTGFGTGALLSPGANQQFLRANSAQTDGLDWVYGSTVVESAFTAAGQLFVGTGFGTGALLSPGTNQQVLISNSAQTDGLQWVYSYQVVESAFGLAGQLAVGTGFGTGELLSKGAAGTVLQVGGTDASGLQWSAPLGVVEGAFTAAGQLLAGTGSGTGTLVPVGSNNSFLMANSGSTGGMEWVYGSVVVESAFVAKGQLFAGTGFGTGDLLSSGTTGQVLTVGGADASGLEWAAIPTTGGGNVPIGAGMIWFTGTAPTGWIICNGQAVSRSTYSALFSLWGTTFGSGDGSSTFNVPNLGGTVPGGYSGSGYFTYLNTIQGAISQTLTAGQIPSLTTGDDSGTPHNHTESSITAISSPSSTIGLVSSGFSNGVTFGGGQITTSQNTPHSHTVGSATPSAVETLQPTFVVNFIVRGV